MKLKKSITVEGDPAQRCKTNYYLFTFIGQFSYSRHCLRLAPLKKSKWPNWNARAILPRACLFHSFNNMEDRSERLRAPRPSIDHVQVLLFSAPGERQHHHQLGGFLATSDHGLSGLQAGESTTTHSRASFAIDDVSSFLPSSLPSFYFHRVPDAAFNPATTH